eukprot:1020193-Pelagomonas_calceolata.AAC.2
MENKSKTSKYVTAFQRNAGANLADPRTEQTLELSAQFCQILRTSSQDGMLCMLCSEHANHAISELVRALISVVLKCQKL